jgi:hypothetical protein
MKNSRAVALKGLTVAALLLGGLTACGGGGDDEAGAPIALNIQPAVVTFTAPKNTIDPTTGQTVAIPAGVCVVGGTSIIYIYGGAAPYRIDNTQPDALSIDVATVSDRGGHFTITVTQPACFDPGLVVVTDKLNNQVVLKVSNKDNTG